MRSRVGEIARWEFLRYFKPRDLVISTVVIAILAGASWLFSWWQERSTPTARVAVIAPMAVESPSPRLVLEAYPAGELPALRDRVRAETLDGILVIEPPRARLIARDEPSWLGLARAAAGEALQSARLAELGITPAQLAAVIAPVDVELDLLGGPPRAGASKTTALLLIGFMLLALLIGVAYLFAAITGEKQNRVTEQVFVMTSAQAMIDGKLIGHGLLALVFAAHTAIGGVIAYEVVSGGAFAWLARTVSDVGIVELAVLVAYAVAGFAFWFTVLAAWFSTINDPQSSARSNGIMLPFLPLSAVLLGWSSPDTAMMQVLAIVPLTSMTVMPARVVLGDPSAIEVAISLVLLVATTWLLRRGAARIYEAAMLMYGKEPSLREMVRWMRARG
jgi:ABC-2 type transport system permease protein